MNSKTKKTKIRMKGKKSAQIRSIGRTVHDVGCSMIKKLKLGMLISLCVLAVLVVLGVTAYLLWPFTYELYVYNSKGDSLVANVTIVNSEGLVEFQDFRHYADIDLWKGNYNVIVTVKGYVVEQFEVSNQLGFRKNKDVFQQIILEPKYINLTQFSFFDPTTALNIFPEIKAIGKNILGEHISETYFIESIDAVDSNLMYGDYYLIIGDEFFNGVAEFRGDLVFQDDLLTNDIVLKSNSKFLKLNNVEFNYVKNFVKDYMLYSSEGEFELENRGLPRQYYLYNQDELISLGKMLFLLCQAETFNAMGVEPEEYFVPREQLYEFGLEPQNVVGCYARGLTGEIPQEVLATVDGADSIVKLEDALFFVLTGDDEGFEYSINSVDDLNIEVRGINVGFTFDVESGRYVFEENNFAVSPCEFVTYGIGLNSSELICDDPALVAWMSPRRGTVSFDEYAYPVVSGIVGYDQTLSYGELYGIPVTNYYVQKDLLAFEETEPELISRTQKLVDLGLIEVGSHTRYHTHLGLVDKDVAKLELIESREFLEEYFGSSVVGIRAPYQSMIGDEKTYAVALGDAGYEYFTQLGEYVGLVPGSNVLHKQWNGNWQYFSETKSDEVIFMLDNKDYLITLDHPWNMAYADDVVLKEKPDSLVNHRANILSVVANGGIPTLAKDIEVMNEKII
ncbi:polysaccharide deacetylase family protein [Candidatus Woesearchaeota archaeon]|jgi:peptidoglycan/xylan/chitin deacetylase (PgdA/CDA1 family)|nr:polysaccharide deacetylase family protein [Candidatus Woesearchaeota archaeon]MBT6519266.1 polysaccharide deacetylase family protein [Candidatus Woesearchaeota archaeon]MBT7368458.1 polysaccharide deacetylase family protein [Candidatus Woesearchaeota archaeon]